MEDEATAQGIREMLAIICLSKEQRSISVPCPNKDRLIPVDEDEPIEHIRTGE